MSSRRRSIFRLGGKIPMKVIHAVWEKRNLGIDCYEVELEAQDSFNEFKDWEASACGEYMVVKVPVERDDIFLKMPSLGYTFIEMATQCHYDNTREFVLNSVQKRLMDQISCVPMDSESLDYMFCQMEAGLFVTDRIAIDPCFSVKMANHRYIGWIKDEIERGATIYKILYRDNHVGFMGMKLRADGQCYAFLGGIYKKFQRIGIGSIMNYLEIIEAKKCGATKLYSAFSSNNRGAYAVHLFMGYILDKSYYVYIKHLNNK